MNAITPVDRYLAELDQQVSFGDESRVGSIRWNIEWYRKRAPWRRNAFRISGLMLLIVSVSLPFASAVFPKESTLWLLPALGYVVAIISALNAFFQWQRAWQSYRTAHLQLEAAWSDWQASRAEAVAESDGQKAFAAVTSAAHRLLGRASDIITSEKGELFRLLPAVDAAYVKKP